MAWKVVAASVAGKSHVDANVPCQDAHAFEDAGQALVAAVCDGAGSAASSDRGARVVADTVVRDLAAAVREGRIAADSTRETLEASAVAAVEHAREHLRADGAGTLREHATTLVCAILFERACHVLHVGDGVAVVRTRDPAAPAVVSAPANGEYANETYFVTADDWQAHLRIRSDVIEVDHALLMSDGAMAFAMSRGLAGPYGPFIDPVMRYVAAHTQREGCAALSTTLADPRTHAITGDDKSLLIALRT